MIVPMNAASRFLILALAWILVAPAHVALSANAPDSAAPSHHAKEPQARPRASRKDRVFLRQAGPTMVLEIYRVTGIGDTILNPPASGWPAAVVVHLHDFPHLEHFMVHTPAVVLTCEQIRPEGARPRQVCHLGHEEVGAIRREPDHFEVTLPARLFEGSGPVDIQWVDQWR